MRQTCVLLIAAVLPVAAGSGQEPKTRQVDAAKVERREVHGQWRFPALGAQWSRAAEAMSRGEYAGIGKPENIAELAPLLHTRATMLQELSEQVTGPKRARDNPSLE